MDSPRLTISNVFPKFGVLRDLFTSHRVPLIGWSLWVIVGSYGTRNIVVIESRVFFGATDRVSCIDLSKFYSSGDPPFRGGFA
jgi:hypothetical protein